MGSPFNATHKFTHLSKPLLYKHRQSTIKIKPISKSKATAPCVPQGAASLQKSWGSRVSAHKNVALEIRVTRCMRNLWGYLPPPPKKKATGFTSNSFPTNQTPLGSLSTWSAPLPRWWGTLLVDPYVKRKVDCKATSSANFARWKTL